MWHRKWRIVGESNGSRGATGDSLPCRVRRMEVWSRTTCELVNIRRLPAVVPTAARGTPAARGRGEAKLQRQSVRGHTPCGCSGDQWGGRASHSTCVQQDGGGWVLSGAHANHRLVCGAVWRSVMWCVVWCTVACQAMPKENTYAKPGARGCGWGPDLMRNKPRMGETHHVLGRSGR